ncbi:MAG TPA: hypothetical protein VK112_05220 [Fodinibius sp.]|nr:hypothetical protein [Fodinibius sp.]
MGTEAGADGGVFFCLRVIHAEVTVGLAHGKLPGRGMVGSLFAEVGVFGRTHRGGNPDPALPVQHGIVDIGFAVP